METNNILEFICNIPKAELHVHIEGTFEPELMFEIAARNHITLKYRDVEALREAYQFRNLQEFLDIYYIGSQALKTERDFYDLTTSYLTKAASQNILHTEIFFDPQTHHENGVAFPVVFNGIYDALQDAEKNLGIHGDVIMCFLRHLDEASAFATLQQALPFKDKIIGVGLDSSERGNPPHKFIRVFEAARQAGFVAVAHAGEEGPVDYIHDSLELLKISRIDHGNNSKDDALLIAKIAQQRIPLTMCPLSNLKLQVVKDLRHHPLKTLLDNKVVATVNSDDPAYFGGYLNENYIAIQQALELWHDDIITLAKNSFEASFIDAAQKQTYMNRIDTFVSDFNAS